MEKGHGICRWIGMGRCWIGWGVVLWVLLGITDGAVAGSKDWKYYGGLTGSRGGGAESRLDMDYTGVGAQWIWQTSDRFGVEVEGHYGRYHIDVFRSDAYGLSIAGRLRILTLGSSDLIFTLGGGGLHMVRGGFFPYIGDHDLLAKFQTGLKFWIPLGGQKRWSIGYRFEHVSDPYTRKDHGINFHCFQVGIYWDL